MREGLLRRKPGEALSHLQNKCVNIFDKDRKMIEFFHEPCYTGTTFRPNHRIGEEGFMNKQHSKRSAFSGKIGFVLSAAGASVGLGNIWRFPYLAAKYGGGIFLLVYIVLAVTFGYTMIVAETALGRMTKKSPVGAFGTFGKSGRLKFGGWINAVIPILIVPYYSVIGGWVIRYLSAYVSGHGSELAQDGYFFRLYFQRSVCRGVFPHLYHFYAGHHFCRGTQWCGTGVQADDAGSGGPVGDHCRLLGHPSGALAGVKYFLVPNVANFSWMTVVTAMGQMFYSLSIAMGILVTFGSYMKEDVSIEESTENVEVFDTAIAIMAGLMIIPAVFSFSGGDPDTLQAGPSLMFITIPKVFESMGFGHVVGVLFFLLVLFAAITSSIALTESAVSTFEDELGWNRQKATGCIGVIMVALGSLSALGYGPLAGCDGVRDAVPGFLRFPDKLGHDAHCGHCHLPAGVAGHRGGKNRSGGHRRRETVPSEKNLQLYDPLSVPVFAAIILVSSVANALGWISM